MNHVTANIVVSTTPQLDVYMLKRSKNVKHYTHVVHAPSDVGFYEKHSFDYYDSVLCSGPHQIKSIRTLEKKRGSKNKQLYETGCTYYDVMGEEVNNISSSKGKKLTVLYAPTWGRVSSLIKYGNSILKPLLNDKFNLIFRPHPQMFISYKNLMDELTSLLKAYESTTLDREPSGLISMAASDIMVSDISGIIFDYAFLFNKPIIAIDGVAETGGFEAEDLEEVWELTIRPKLCRTIKESDIPQLSNIILEEINNISQRKLVISEIKNQFVYNFYNAGEVAAKQLIEINKNLKGN
jgi:CDP-glycerol glycerophosphotransferase (TagB/SpsB family)